MGEQFKASSPYEGLDKRSYWRSGVVDSHPLKMPDLYRRKFELRADDKIATAGSCFAQHIARAMRGKGYEVLDV